MSEDERKLANRLEHMGIEAGQWSHELRRQRDEGVPVGDLVPEAEIMMREAQDAAARLLGEKLYNVNLRYDRVLAADQEAAIDRAKEGRAHLAYTSAELVYDPGAASPVLGEVRVQEPEGRPPAVGPGEAPVDAAQFLRVFRELCVDPVTGEVDLPDFALVSYPLRDAIVRDRPPELLDPGPELGFLAFPVSFANHSLLKNVSGTEDHVLLFDRRRRSGETVEVVDPPAAAWRDAVDLSVDA